MNGAGRLARLAAAAAALLALPAGAVAHNFWLQPEAHTVEEGGEVEVDFKIGDAGENAANWSVLWERIAAFRLYGPAGASDQQRALRITGSGEKGGATLNLAAPGTHVLAFESHPSFSDLEAARFDRYVANEGLTAIAAHRARMAASSGASSGASPEGGLRNGTELYVRRAKALVQVGDALTANVTQPVGQLLEITPLANPFALEAGDTLTVELRFRGEPLEGARLHVMTLARNPLGEVITTDASGQASFVLEPGSRYLLASVWGVPAPNDDRADYFTVFSSLTFDAPHAGGSAVLR